MVHIVCEDDANPVIAALLRALLARGFPVRMETRSLQDDIQFLLRARTVAIGRGSFMPGVLAMSDNAETVIMFDHCQLWGGRDVRTVRISDENGAYNADIMRNWQNTEAQRRLMIDYPLSALSIRPDPG